MNNEKNEGNEGNERYERYEGNDVQPKDALLQSILKPKCDLCGSLMIEFHCRLICPACGYQRDCSDP